MMKDFIPQAPINYKHNTYHFWLGPPAKGTSLLLFTASTEVQILHYWVTQGIVSGWKIKQKQESD